MNRCAAVKRKGSTDPCRASALRGNTLCGRHARMRAPVLWIDATLPRILPLLKIQACIRGWLIRKRMSYAGIGALRRKDLANDEDIITCSEKDRVHPMDFFSFEENGKIWWFEFGSLWMWCMRNVRPTNPYTKVPLSSDTRKRLRMIWGYKRRHRETTPDEPIDFRERLRYKTNILIQHFEDYGFVGVQPQFLLSCCRSEFMSFFVFLKRDIETVIPVSDPFRIRMISLCRNRINIGHSSHPEAYILNCFSTLLYMITVYRDPYALTFSILSAFYRV